MQQETGLLELASGVFAKIYPEGRTNAGFVVGDEAVLVVDSLMTPSLARELQEDVRRVCDRPIRYLVNTHYHGDHTFGNETFAPTPIISHRRCREELAERGEESLRRFATMRAELAPELEGVRIRLPNVTFTDSLDIDLGGITARLVHPGPAHTGGDAFVHVSERGVLFAGDLLFARMVPFMGDAHPQSWVQALDQLDGIDTESVVPGHGLMATPKELREQRDVLADLCAVAAEAFREGVAEEEGGRSPQLAKYAGLPRAEGIVVGIRRAYAELRGEL